MKNQPQPNMMEKAEKKCICDDDRASGTFSNGHFRNCPLVDDKPQPAWDWEVQFEKQFPVHLKEFRGDDGFDKDIKSFIADTVSRAVEEERGRIIKELKELKKVRFGLDKSDGVHVPKERVLIEYQEDWYTFDGVLEDIISKIDGK